VSPARGITHTDAGRSPATGASRLARYMHARKQLGRDRISERVVLVVDAQG
jgi:hypothetical protein